VTIQAKQFLYRYLDRTGLGVLVEWHFQRGTNLGMLYATGESHRESLRVCYPAGHLSAPVQLLTGPEAVNSCCPFRGIELGRVLEERYPSPVHLLGHPAFMPDMAVAAALI
jgi:hypothetical protein